jgi:hypothetical protein
MSVATQLACAARRSQPGDGADASPPTERDMSVSSVSSPGPLTLTLNPPDSCATAALSV